MTRPSPFSMNRRTPVSWSCGVIAHWHDAEAEAQACLDADAPCPGCGRRRSACPTAGEALEADGHAVSSCLECLLTDAPRLTSPAPSPSPAP